MNYIRFPVNLTFRTNCPFERPMRDIKAVKAIHPNWKALTETPSGEQGANYGILTGQCTGITVVDIAYGANTSFLDYMHHAYQVKTPYGGTHYYFKYVPELVTRYDAYPGISVVNDSGCVFRGYNYVERDPATPIGTIPDSLLNKLLARQQMFPRHSIDMTYYELLNVCSTEWFQDQAREARRGRHQENERSLGYVGH
ncbi:hypothetical protein PHYPSEUDO_013291 [Phytophthora pseudosyringae]|uniref:DNA primase/polymerase bifunctional N-terminal domain-containing protein n=1 Tax=Phytophthora pseudosyringae TaxID=221518 RepID=A0A8T1V8V4_9STRA|nr:hypothetical protein PHYPSEUDO_013291 [Phytophthora pseudosyringae]